MSVHIVVYVRWQIISRWKRLVLKYACNGLPVFAYGSNDNRQFAKYAKNGATLWVIASHRLFPPTLVAQLENIERVEKGNASKIPPGLWSELKPIGIGKKYDFIVKGSDDSRFFGHNNALPVLKELEFLSSKGNILKGSKEEWVPRKHGIMLMRPHRVANDYPLTNFADKLDKNTVFMSWKHCDVKGRKHENLRKRDHVKAFAKELNDNGLSVWLDELALPKYKPNTSDDHMMDLLLKQGLDQSHVIIAVSSDHYGRLLPGSEINWTKQEWESKPKKDRVVLFTCEQELDSQKSESEIESVNLDQSELQLHGNPIKASKKFLEWFNNRPGRLG